MSILGPPLPHNVEWGAIRGWRTELSVFPRPPHQQEETGPVRKDLKVQRKNLPRLFLPIKRNVPAAIGMNGSPKVPLTWLLRPLDGSPQTEVGLAGLTGHFSSRLKPPEDSLPRPYQDSKALLPRPCESRSSVPMVVRLREFAHKWMGITQDPFVLGTIQGHLLQFSQKPPSSETYPQV